MWKQWGIPPLELLEWPHVLIESMQACEIVEIQRTNPSSGVSGDAS